MSTEPEQPTTDTTSATEPEPTEPPPPLNIPPQQTYEPATYYSVTSVCITQDCPNLNTTTTEPMVYSNAGTIIMICGPCGQRRPIMEATKLDPQPEVS